MIGNMVRFGLCFGLCFVLVLVWCSITYIDNCSPLVVLGNEKGDNLINCVDKKLRVTDARSLPWLV